MSDTHKYDIVVNNDLIIPSHTMCHYMYMGLRSVMVNVMVIVLDMVA